MNRAKALSIDEFFNCVVQLAVMRYVLSGHVISASEAIQRLFNCDIEPRCEPATFLDANDFRREHCYVEATDAVLRRHEPALRLIFAALAVKRGPAKKLLTFEAWAKFMRRVDLVGNDLTERDVAFAFAWSRMVVAQPYCSSGALKSKHLPFESFLEALCRISGLKALPTDAELLKGPTAGGVPDPRSAVPAGAVEGAGSMGGGPSRAGQYLATLRSESPQDYDDLITKRATAWGSPPSQPLCRCVDHLLSLIFWRIESETTRSGVSSGTAEIGEKEVGKFFNGFDQS